MQHTSIILLRKFWNIFKGAQADRCGEQKPKTKNAKFCRFCFFSRKNSWSGSEKPKTKNENCTNFWFLVGDQKKNQKHSGVFVRDQKRKRIL